MASSLSLPVRFHGLSGKPSAPAMLLLHGWPDDDRIFASQVSHFAAAYRIAAVRLPWFDPAATAAAESSARRYGPWGYDFDKLVAAVAHAAKRLGAGKEVGKVVLVGHDWGAVIAFLAEQMYPDLFSHVIAMDVSLSRWMFCGPDRSAKEALRMVGVGLAYQFPLIFAFLLAQVPGLAPAADALATAVARRITERALYSRPGNEGRLESLRKDSPVAHGIDARSGYVYFYLWTAYLCGFFGFGGGRGVLVPGVGRMQVGERHKYPKCPVLFLYGKDKPFSFHDEGWVREVERRTDGSRVVPCLKSSHWLLVEEADKVNCEMEAFLGGK